MKPAAEPASATVLGWTKRSSGSVQSTWRRSRCSGSARTERTGPTTITARRAVGMVKRSSWTCCGFHPGQVEHGGGGAHRQFQGRRQQRPGGGVGDRDAADGAVPHRHPGPGQVQDHAVGGAAQDEADGEHEQDERGDRGGLGFLPAEGLADGPQQDRGRQDGPAQDAHHGQHGPDVAQPERAGRRARPGRGPGLRCCRPRPRGRRDAAGWACRPGGRAVAGVQQAGSAECWWTYGCLCSCWWMRWCCRGAGSRG